MARTAKSFINSPSIQDIESAQDFLFPDVPAFPNEGWRIWTDDERMEINKTARIIMNARLGNDRIH